MSAVDIAPKPISLHRPLSLDGPDMEEELLKPFTYLSSIPEKKIKQNVVHVLGQWTPVPGEKVKQIAQLVQPMQYAGLLLDDILDYSSLRRGIPTAHRVYGIIRTVLAVNVLKGRYYDLLHQLQNKELTKTCIKDYAGTLAGQGMDIYWRENSICPTEKEYIEMIYRKTCLVFILVHNPMNTFTTAKKVDVRKFLTMFGIYFQIHDDYQNLQSEFYYDSKGFCEDITEGKFSFPIVHAINNFPKEGKVIKDILHERTQDVERKKELLSMLAKCGSFEYTKKVLKELKTAVYSEAVKLGDNPLIQDYIEKMMFDCH